MFSDSAASMLAIRYVWSPIRKRSPTREKHSAAFAVKAGCRSATPKTAIDCANADSNNRGHRCLIARQARRRSSSSFLWSSKFVAALGQQDGQCRTGQLLGGTPQVR